MIKKETIQALNGSMPKLDNTDRNTAKIVAAFNGIYAMLNEIIEEVERLDREKTDAVGLSHDKA